MPITTLDGIVSAMGTTTAQCLPFAKTSLANQGAGGWTSLFKAGGWPLAGNTPAGSSVCSSTDTGAMTFTATATTTTYSYISNMAISGSASHQVYLVDRLYHVGGLAGNLNTTQTASVVIPANRDASVGSVDIMWFLEIYADIGTTTVTATINFTNQADAATTTTLNFAGASPLNRAGRIFQIVPPAGNQIKATNHILLSATTGVAGNFGIFCCRVLASSDMGPVNIGISKDFAQLGLPKVPNGAHLNWILMSSATASGTIQGCVKLIQG